MAEATDLANQVHPIDDYEDYWLLHRILTGVNDEGTHATWLSREGQDLAKDLKAWLGGERNRMKYHGTFLMMAPFDHAIKKGSHQYHFFVGPNIPYEGTDHKVEETDDGKTFYDAMAFAAILMSQYGRVWTNDIWQDVKDTNPEAYPFLCEQEWRSPVLCIFQAEGQKFAFGFKEDPPNEYNTHKEGASHDKSLGKKARKGWQTKRARHVLFTFSDQMQNLVKGQINGLDITFEKRINNIAMNKVYTQAGELSGPSLKEWVDDVISGLDH